MKAKQRLTQLEKAARKPRMVGALTPGEEYYSRALSTWPEGETVEGLPGADPLPSLDVFLTSLGKAGSR